MFQNRQVGPSVCFYLEQPYNTFTKLYDTVVWSTISSGAAIWGTGASRVYRGSYMSAHVLLNLLNELRKRDKMRGLPSILSLFRNEFNKFNNTRARMLDSIYHMTLRLL